MGKTFCWGHQEHETKWRGQQAVSRESLQTSCNLYFPILTRNQQEKPQLTHIHWSVEITCLWRQTLEETSMDILRWQNRQGIHGTDTLRVCATTDPKKLPTNYGHLPRAITWNRKVSKNRALFRKDTSVVGALTIISSRQSNQSSCPHWWTSWEVLDRFLRSLRSNIY